MRYDPIVGLFRVFEGGGKGQPAAPDYQGAAATQAASSKEATTVQNWANRPTVNTPFGTQTWDTAATTDPATGLPVTDWTQNINLNPESQAALNNQLKIGAGKSDIAQGLMGQVAQSTATPFDWAGMPKVPGSLEDAQSGAFQKMSASLQPMRNQNEASLDNKLANMGLPRNSEAWNRAKQQLQSSWAQENKGLLSQSLAEGRADVSSQAGLRQQAIAEEAQRRGMSLNELNALLTGAQVSMPQGMGQAPNSTAAGSQPLQSLAAANAQGNYNAQMAGNNDWGSGIGGIASVAGAAAAFSDRRLKSNIRQIGMFKGFKVYEYIIFGKPEIGVIAQEVRRTRPDLVSVHPSGYLMVNYGGL